MNSHIKNISIFFFCLLTAIANGYFFNYLNQRYFHYSWNENGLSDFSKNIKYLIVVIICIIVETILFNMINNLALKKLKVSRTFILIFVQSIVF